jgi:hypothetical protein
MKEKVVWFLSGGVVSFLVFVLLGSLYTITPPNGPVDTAYKMNRITGRVWMIKTYTKQVGPIRVVAARQADVEKSKELKESDIPPVAMQEEPLASSQGRRR